jgi:predicted ArsR family transcriptional regulator
VKSRAISPVAGTATVQATAAATASATVQSAAAGSRTRQRVEQLLLDEGPATATALAERLDLTTAGVRRHLDAMVEEGVLDARDARPTPWRARGRGRPAKIYTLSASGHARAPHAYDELAVDTLRYLAEQGGIEDFAVARAERLRDRYASVQGTQELAEALSKDGYAATVHTVPTGTQICQHHCPVSTVAAQFPQLCEAETAAIGQLLGTHVQRLATIAHGDGVCTTHVPNADHEQEHDRHDSRNPRKGN